MSDVRGWSPPDPREPYEEDSSGVVLGAMLFVCLIGFVWGMVVMGLIWWLIG